MSIRKDHADRRQTQRCWAATGRPAWLRGLAVMLLFMGWTASPCWGQEGNPQALVRQIVAAWQQRQRVRTLRCRAQVESFYPRGYLSALAFPLLKSPTPLPPKDCRFTDGFCFWALELSGAKVKKIRKEYAWMQPYLDEEKRRAEFIQRHTLFLYTDGQCRLFWPVPGQEVTLGCSTMGMISSQDRPLAWVLGRVNGEVVSVAELECSEPVERFTYRGQAEYKGQKCVVLTLPEQNTQTLLREFWVGLGPGHPIYYCRCQKGDRVYSEIEVEYSSEGQGEVPRRWTVYEHLEKGLIAYDTFTVREWQVNVSLPDELFVREYQPGETVYDMPRSQKFRVDAQGQLVPLTPVVSEPRTWLRILMPAWLILILILLVWYGVRRLLRRAIKN
jgi:hypothetical protein